MYEHTLQNTLGAFQNVLKIFQCCDFHQYSVALKSRIVYKILRPLKMAEQHQTRSVNRHSKPSIWHFLPQTSNNCQIKAQNIFLQPLQIVL